MSNISRLLPKSWKFYLFNFIICTVFILAGTLSPIESKLPKEFWSNDKLVHFLAFAVWTFLLGLYRFFKKDYKLWPIFVWAIFFGILIEMLQYVLPINRSAELYDFIADGLGAGVAIVFLYIIHKKLPWLFSSPTS